MAKSSGKIYLEPMPSSFWEEPPGPKSNPGPMVDVAEQGDRVIYAAQLYKGKQSLCNRSYWRARWLGGVAVPQRRRIWQTC